MRAARNWSSSNPATKKTSISGTSASRSRCRISSTFTNCSTFITTSSAAKVFTTIAWPASLSGCSSPASPRLAKARSSFSFVTFPSWRTSRASFARATADSITPPATSRRLSIESPNLADAEKIEIARTIGIGAVKYADLSQYRMTDYVFSWEKMLALQGNTAPYLQNAYVRVRSIFRKAGEAAAKIEKFVLHEAAEITLAKRLCQFAEIVPQVLNDFRPNILANYLFELANNFHAFYEGCPVLRSDEPVRSSRLALCDLTGRVLQRGLDLLGIKVPEKM